MKERERILSIIEDCIKSNKYIPVETERIELKPTPPNLKAATSMLQSVCAFLNTKGGIIVIGVKDKGNANPKHYELTGYNEDFENTLKLFGKQFTNKKNEFVDVSQYIVGHEIKEILNSRICFLYVDRLPDERKYVFFEKIAYRRELTGDHSISESDILRHEEYLEEIETAKELETIQDATLDDIDIDKLNSYIQLLNREIRVESLKTSIQDAKSFLFRKRFVLNDQITTLGMLVCGHKPKDFLGWKCQVDGFVDTPFEVAQDKKSLVENIIPLMEQSLGYVLKNIQVGVSLERGGSSMAEYPEQLLRETINNALAHRDYSINKYININIRPNELIEIRNPGSFKKSLLIEELDNQIPIRRIVPDSKPRNPRLADVLKVFDKWEGKARGMSNLVTDSLQNKIDLPYYKFHSINELSLVIKKGKLLDDKMEALIKSYEGYIEKKLNGSELTQEQKLVLAYFYKSEIENKNDRYTILLTKDNNHLDAINSLEDAKLIIKHSGSTELFPIFIIDRELFKRDFINELRILYGADFDVLPKETKQTLESIFEMNKYAKDPFPSANSIGNTLWAKLGRSNSIEGFEDFKRRIRSAVNKMEKRGIIKRVNNKPRYQINDSFRRRPSIYD
jgi:predicted HTH transcriptional regulator